MQPVNIHQHEVAGHIHHIWPVAEKIKPTAKWFALVAVAAAVFTYLFATFAEEGINGQQKYLFALFFLLTGLPHVFIFPRWVPLAQSSQRFFYTLLLSSIIFAIVYLMLAMLSINDIAVAASAGIAFLLPALVQVCWFYFSVMLAGGKAWYMPKDAMPETRKSLVLLNSMPVTIQINSTPKDTTPLDYRIAMNPRLALSVLFVNFLHERHDAISAINDDGEATGWCFFVQRWYGLKILDADKTLEKNRVKENDTLIIERA